MPALPWVEQHEIDPNRDYVAMATRLPLISHRSIPAFLRDTNRIRRQLAATPGLVGFTLNADLVHKTFWTFSAWIDDASLRAFASADPHRMITQRWQTRMDTSRLEQFSVSGADLPLTWDVVKQRVR